jgi:Ca2+-binding RTX toxin-like protein
MNFAKNKRFSAPQCADRPGGVLAVAVVAPDTAHSVTGRLPSEEVFMTTIIANATATVSTTAAGDNVYIGGLGSLITSGDSVTSAFGSVGYQIDGTIYSSGGIGISMTGATTLNSIVVDASGSITGLTDAIKGVVDSTMILNNGVISGIQGGIYLEGQNNTITNNGSISTINGYAVTFSSTGNRLNLNNAGNITSNDGGLQLSDYVEVVNSGTISADSYGISGQSFNVINNTGIIEGATSLYFSGLNNHIYNDGKISGPSGAVLYFSAGYGFNYVHNNGHIYGQGDAITCQGNADLYVYNHGRIDGAIVFGGGNDLYDGHGGTLNGTIQGGGGNDIYIVDDADIDVVEDGSGGTDDMRSTVTFHLAEGQEIERLTLLGNSAIKGFGNEFGNLLTGNEGDNSLRGGDGDDTLIGRYGADILDGGSGVDTASYAGARLGVKIDMSAKVQSGGEADGDTLVSIEGVTGTDGRDTLLGNSAGNILDGGEDNDTLDGKGGGDTLYGGNGNDIYLVDSASDVTAETGHSGVDTVKSTVTYTLDLANELENLILNGSGNINGTGNLLDNDITGNSGKNKLKGGGGEDTFVFKSNFGADSITDFTASDDHIDLHAINTIITSFSDLKNHHATDKGSNLEIDAGHGDVLVIKNIHLADLSAADFLFAP